MKKKFIFNNLELFDLKFSIVNYDDFLNYLFSENLNGYATLNGAHVVYESKYSKNKKNKAKH